MFLPGVDSLHGKMNPQLLRIGLIRQLIFRGPRELKLDQLNEILFDTFFHSKAFRVPCKKGGRSSCVAMEEITKNFSHSHVRGTCFASLTQWLLSVPQLALKDPVHTVSLQQFIYEKLKAQQELLGEQGFQSLMETVDTEIVTQLQEFLQGF